MAALEQGDADALAGLDGVLGVARRLFTGVPTLAAIGPIGKVESFEAIRGRLG